MSKKIKKAILPGITLAVSFYYASIIFVVGIILGYLGTDFFKKRFLDTGKIKLIILRLGDYRVHVHHWILGGVAVSLISYIGLAYSLPVVVLGGLGGLIVHDFHTDKEWYRVIYKQ
ncbi:MAG: hypothetical protein U9Q16_00395 [Patescibacteria group bacterium]|nr:hypothetical protein [Patescibacteria group bacterium]